MKRFLQLLAAGFVVALALAFGTRARSAEVSALNGIAIDTDSTVNGISTFAAINGQTVVSGVVPYELNWLNVFNAQSAGATMTTGNWASTQFPSSIGTVTLYNTAGALSRFTYENYSYTSPIVFDAGGTLYYNFTKALVMDLTARTAGDGAYYGVQQAFPSGVFDCIWVRIGEYNAEPGASDVGLDPVSADGATAVLQASKSTTDVTPGSAGVVRAHGTGGIGGGIASSTSTVYIDLLGKEFTGQRVWVIRLNGTTGAWIGSSQVASTTTEGAAQIISDYLDADSGNLKLIALGAKHNSLTPPAVTLPAVTGLTIAQVVPDEKIVTWAVPSNTGTNTLSRFKVERAVSGGMRAELAGSPTANTYFVDNTGGLSSGNSVQYWVTHVPDDVAVTDSAEATQSSTVDNSAVLPVTANLVAHYLADGLLGYANNDRVPTYTDYSGNGFNATQGGSSQQPLYKTNSQNGLPGVAHDGADDYLSATLTGIDPDRDVFIVFKKSSAAGGSTDGLSGFGAANTAIVGYANSGSPSSSGLNYYATNGGAEQGLGNTTLTAAHVINFSWASTSSLSVRLDNGTATTFDPNDSYNSATLTLGAAPGPSDYGDFVIYEVVIYNGALSTGDRSAVHTYLKAKWGTP